MAFTEGPLAPFSAALLVLSESSTLFNVLSKNFLVEEALIDTFDGVRRPDCGSEYTLINTSLTDTRVERHDNSSFLGTSSQTWTRCYRKTW